MALRPTRLLILLAALLLGGCTGTSTFPGNRTLAGEPYLGQGIAFYEEGDYRAAGRRLMFALEEGLCVSGHQLTCREEFAIALKLDPDFELDEAESGHPIWGPVFRSAKAASASKR